MKPTGHERRFGVESLPLWLRRMSDGFPGRVGTPGCSLVLVSRLVSNALARFLATRLVRTDGKWGRRASRADRGSRSGTMGSGKTSMTGRISREAVREALTGPFGSLHTPFERDGSISRTGLSALLDQTIGAGGKTALLTYGDSLFSILSDKEVGELTKMVVEVTAGRAMVVAADRDWWTGKAVEFAKYARDVGADVLMAKPPIWGGSATTETFVEHYAALAEHVPIMVVTNVFGPSPEPGLATIERLRDEVDGIVAIKDDLGGEFVRKMCLLVHEKWAVFAGGQKQNHLNMVPYGVDGYMSTFINFMPSVTHEYWQAVQRQDWSKASQVIRDYDSPLFDYLGGLPGGFDAGVHAALELFGIAERWRRKPYYSLSDEEMEGFSGFLKSRGWL